MINIIQFASIQVAGDFAIAVSILVTAVHCAATCTQAPKLKEFDMCAHEKINYVEFPARDLSATKAFFQAAFGCSFTDYGPEYTAFADQGLDGGFFQSEMHADTANGSALIVFYSERLEETLGKVSVARGKIVKPIFTFPGGRRFHFAEPSGNEFAVWSQADA